MGLLIEGKWQDRWYDTKATGGHFKRTDAAFRNQVVAEPDATFSARSEEASCRERV